MSSSSIDASSTTMTLPLTRGLDVSFRQVGSRWKYPLPLWALHSDFCIALADDSCCRSSSSRALAHLNEKNAADPNIRRASNNISFVDLFGSCINGRSLPVGPKTTSKNTAKTNTVLKRRSIAIIQTIVDVAMRNNSVNSIFLHFRSQGTVPRQKFLFN
jgi:hypothetical protein